MRPFWIPAALTLILAGLAAPATAGDGGWHLRAFAAWADPSIGDTVPNDAGGDVRASGSSDLGLGAALEYRFHDRFGLELGALSVSPGIRLSGDVPGVGRVSVEDSLSTLALLLDFDLHLTPDHPALDFYLGAGWADLSLGDLSFAPPGGERLSFAVRDSSGWTAKAGLDYTFGAGGWGVSAGLRYIAADLEASQRGDPSGRTERFDSDFLVGTLGVAYRF